MPRSGAALTPGFIVDPYARFSPSSAQAPRPLRVAAVSRFGEADRMRRNRRERPRHGGRERDNEPPRKTAPSSHEPRDRVSSVDQRRAEDVRAGARRPGPPQGRRPGAIAGPRRRAAAPP